MHSLAPPDGLFRTERLSLRLMDRRDAEFLVVLLNDPKFIKSIGDREVRTRADALAFLEYSVRDSYRSHGFGPYLIEWQGQAPEGAVCGTAAGLCGLYRREYLTCADVGYALLPAYRGLGIAREAARATLRFARDVLAVQDVVGIIAPGNAPSARVLEHCGMRLAGTLCTSIAETVSELYVPRATARRDSDFFHADRATLTAPG